MGGNVAQRRGGLIGICQMLDLWEQRGAPKDPPSLAKRRGYSAAAPRPSEVAGAVGYLGRFHGHGLEDRAAEGGRDRDVGGVAAAGDHDPALAPGVVPWVE